MSLRGQFFVAGTDTDVGKTYVCCQLLRAAAARGWQCVGLKPLAAGAEYNSEGWRNDDALRLMAASSLKLSYEQVNPLCLPQACAPHIAAAEQSVDLKAGDLAQALASGLEQAAACELVLVEGAGGWLVPLNARETMADVARELGLPVLLVVGMKLGCINHALLTAQSIRATGLELAGWVANDLGESMPWLAQNVAALEKRLNAPRILLG